MGPPADRAAKSCFGVESHTASDIVYLPLHLHARSAASVQSAERLSICTIIVPDDLLARAAQDVIRDVNLELRANDYVDDASLHHLMALMWMEHKNEHSMGTLYWDSLGVALAVSLLTRHSRAFGKQTFTRGGLGQYALRRCLDYLEANLDSPIRLEHLAKEADVSLSHFSRAFHASVGDPPHRYLQQRRIERAKTLMADRKLSLTDVALASGFADQHHLSRVFRRNTGSTPSYYRRFLGR